MSREQDDTPEERDAAEARDAMTRTVEEARLLAEQHREEGWKALVVPAVDTAPVPTDAEDDEWGFVHVVPDNFADRISEACADGSFPRYDIYRRHIGGTVLFVTELFDPETETVLLVAGQYSTEDAAGLYREATDTGRIRTVLQRLDGERLARFDHEDIEKFFPDGMAARSGRE